MTTDVKAQTFKLQREQVSVSCRQKSNQGRLLIFSTQTTILSQGTTTPYLLFYRGDLKIFKFSCFCTFLMFIMPVTYLIQIQILGNFSFKLTIENLTKNLRNSPISMECINKHLNLKIIHFTKIPYLEPHTAAAEEICE